jgi:hypothetical protein
MANKDITETGVRSVLETMGIPSSFQGFKDNAIGRVEAAATIGSSMAGTVAGMGGNIFELMRSGDPQAALDQYRQIQESMTYAPRTQGGLERVQQIGQFFEPVGQLYEQYGESVAEATGSPLAGEYAEEFLDPLLFLGGIGAIPKRASRIADAATDVADVAADAKDLAFLHNTTAQRLARQMNMGGMPNPSIAVTQADIPFEGFGDITLVGKPESFDPAQRENLLYAADAYTVRAPSPVRLAKKEAYKQMQEDFRPYKEYGNVDDVVYSLGNLEKKTRLDPYDFQKINDFLDYDIASSVKFLEDSGIEVPKKPDGRIDTYAVRDTVRQNADKMDEWKSGFIQKYFDPEEYFVTNPDYDRYSGRSKIKPYTAENVSQWMSSRSGSNKEGNMTFGAGNIRASTAEQIKSLDEAKQRKGLLKSSDDVAEVKQTSTMMLDDLQSALRPYYKYDAKSFGYFDDVGEMIALSEKKNLSGALKEVGFEDVPDELIKEINDYKDYLRSAPTEYFESKPQRPVQLSEFAGAIVPEGTPQSTIDFLKDKGLQVEMYKDEAGRTSARKKFSNEFFILPAAALIGASAMQSEGEQTAQPEA